MGRTRAKVSVGAAIALQAFAPVGPPALHSSAVTSFQLAAIVLSLAAVLAYVNARFLRLPATVGLMVVAMVGSLGLMALDATGLLVITPQLEGLVADLDFGNTLLHGMLGLMLFAGALHVDVGVLGAQKTAVATLAIAGTLISTALVGVATYAVLSLLGLPLRFVDALLFGALISPTDPIAVLGMLKLAKAPKELEVWIAGESLFNDGVGVVVFGVLLTIASGGESSVGHAAIAFSRETFGGAAFGFVAGLAAMRLVRSIDDYSVEVLITLALVIGGYALAEAIHVSAPIAAVVAGLVIGHQGRGAAMSDATREQVDLFWKLVDDILNAVLFLMMGLSVMLLVLSAELAAAAAVAIPIVLGARVASVAVSILPLGSLRRACPRAVPLLAWGGLRGGLAIAMALSVPASSDRDVILTMTYAVVAWSIVVQGLTFPRLLRRLGIGS